MKKSMKTILAALALATPLALTSCEGTLDDVFGEWDKPSANTNPSSDPTPAVDHSNQYLVYSYTTALDSTWTNIEGATIWTGTVAPGNVAAGTYVVEGTATCAGQLVLMGEVNLILKDGAKLTVDDGIHYDTTGDAGSLNIYGQGISSSMGQLIVNNNTPYGLGTTEASALVVKALSIHGGKIDATADTGATPADTGGDGLEVPSGAGDLIIYNGLVTATAKKMRTGIALWGTGKINIHGGEIFAYSPGGQGITAHNAGNGTLNITGGKVTAKDTNVGKAPGEGIDCDIINITGGIVIAANAGGGNPAINASVSLSIDGSETQVTATGGNGADGDMSYYDGIVGSIGINAPTIQIDGGTVIATGGNGGNGYTAVGFRGNGGDGGDGISCTDIAVDASASVTATGGNGGNVVNGSGKNVGAAGKGLNTANPATGTIAATDGTAGTDSL